MDTGNLESTIVVAAGIIAGGIRWGAAVLAKAINGHNASMKDNTEALKLNTAKAATILLLLAGLFLVSSCGAADPFIIRAMERDRQIWEEDRRSDLDPELIKSREREFDSHIDYAKAGDDE